MTSTTDATGVGKACPHCGAALERITVEFGGRVHTVGTKACQCPGAVAELRAQQERERVAIEAERKRKLIESYRRAGIPPRYHNAEHERAQQLLTGVKNGNGYYLFSEKNGTGKTQLAMCTAKLAIASGMSVAAYYVPDVLAELRTRSARAEEIIERAKLVDLLLLDDLGKEASNTPTGAEAIGRVINHRYNSIRPILVTSNLKRSELIDAISEGGNGIAIASRLQQMTEPVELTGCDRRITRGKVIRW